MLNPCTTFTTCTNLSSRTNPSLLCPKPTELTNQRLSWPRFLRARTRAKNRCHGRVQRGRGTTGTTRRWGVGGYYRRTGVSREPPTPTGGRFGQVNGLPVPTGIAVDPCLKPSTTRMGRLFSSSLRTAESLLDLLSPEVENVNLRKKIPGQGGIACVEHLIPFDFLPAPEPVATLRSTRCPPSSRTVVQAGP